MTWTELHNLIRTRFKIEVSDPEGLATVYDNDPTPPPTDGSLWCRFTIVRGESRRITCGTREYRESGRAMACLFGPVGRGDAGLLGLADAIAVAFRSQQAGGIRYLTPSVQPVGESLGEYQINVACPFEADTQEA